MSGTGGYEGAPRSRSPGRGELEPGAVFGRYTITRGIGHGGMAAVYEARHTDLHKRVALKVLHRWLALRTDVVQRFVLEARAASRLSHPHVVGITDIGAIDGIPFMAMDFLEGEELAAVIDRSGQLPVARIADVLLPILSAVAAIHEAGILHRDLKPDNIFLARRRPHGEHPMLLDFGISKVESVGTAQPLTAAGEVLGTPPYMSPEQVLRGMEHFDARSDQYALGVVLYECATGAVPYRNDASLHALMAAIAQGGAPPVSSKNPSVPPAFDAIVTRAMSLRPEDRFLSILDLGQALLPFAGALTQALWTDEFGAPDVSVHGGAEDGPTPRPPTGGPGRARNPPVALRPDALRALPFFAEAPHSELARLPAIAPAFRVVPGSALFDQGTKTSSCFFLVSGDVEIYRTYGAETLEAGIAGPGAVLGLAALWDDAKRPVSVVARTDCVVVELRRSALAQLGSECPVIADKLHDDAVTAAVRRHREAGERVADLLDRPVADPPASRGGRASTAPAGASGRGSPAKSAPPDATVSQETLVRLAAALGEWSVPLPAAGRSRRPIPRG
jgi:CRP-like cAMP-binding protein/tRNA A-37 threonylcarbamoyl transferase component Bud32